MPIIFRTLASAHEIAAKLRDMKQKAAYLTDIELHTAIATEEQRLRDGGESLSKYEILWGSVLRAEWSRRHLNVQ